MAHFTHGSFHLPLWPTLPFSWPVLPFSWPVLPYIVADLTLFLKKYGRFHLIKPTFTLFKFLWQVSEIFRAHGRFHIMHGRFQLFEKIMAGFTNERGRFHPVVKRKVLLDAT